MQLVSSVLALGLTAPVLASPVMEALLGRSLQVNDPCDGGRTYCGWWDKAKKIEPQCKCNKDWSWDDDRRVCRAPVIPRPQLKATQKAICARSETDWCDYNEHDDRCRADGKSTVIIIEVAVPDSILPPVIAVPKERLRPSCMAGQYWEESYDQCRYPIFSPSVVSTCKQQGGRPICARTPDDWCDFGEREAWCQDDGINALQCIEPYVDAKATLGKIFASLPTAIEVLGYECMNRGKDCPLKSSDYDKLCIGVDCVAGLICSIVFIAGLC